MDTQLAYNQLLVDTIKAEASSFGFYEAFLESTPQFILQLSIFLRTGSMSKIIDKFKNIYIFLVRKQQSCYPNLNNYSATWLSRI